MLKQRLRGQKHDNFLDANFVVGDDSLLIHSGSTIVPDLESPLDTTIQSSSTNTTNTHTAFPTNTPSLPSMAVVAPLHSVMSYVSPRLLFSSSSSPSPPTLHPPKTKTIFFRSIQPTDRPQIQRLHEEWFPVKYQTEFYDDLVHGKLHPTGDELYTKVAVVLLDDEPQDDDTTFHPATATVSHHPPTTIGDNNNNNPNNNNNNHHHPKGNDKIIACIVATMVPAHRLNRASRELLLPDSFQPHHQRQGQGRRQRHYSRPFPSSSPSSISTTSACYIMTLGTVPEYRQFGVATALVQQCIQDMVLTNPYCGALYLHVITTNPAAIAFYEQDCLKFHRVKEIPNYYTIDQKLHSCYLYAKYFHGNRGHLDIFQILVSWIFLLWSKVKEPLLFLWFKQRATWRRLGRGSGGDGSRDEESSHVDHMDGCHNNHTGINAHLHDQDYDSDP